MNRIEAVVRIDRYSGLVQRYSDEVFYGGEAYLPDPEQFLLRKEARQFEKNILLLLTKRLMPVERQVFFCIYGIHGGRMTLAETARHLGMTKGAVHQSCRRILKRAFLFREDCVSAGFPLLRGEAKWFNPEDELSLFFCS